MKTKQQKINRSKKEKLTKKETNDILLKLKKQNLKFTKQMFMDYLEALVKYDMDGVGLMAIRSQRGFQDELNKRLRDCIKNKKSFMEGILGKPGNRPTEIEHIKSEIKYYEKLTNLIKTRIKNLSHDVKMRMARDSIEYFSHYLEEITKGLEPKSVKKSNQTAKVCKSE